MKNELSVAVYKLNFEYIFKNYLKKELWKQEWTLYKDDKVKATLCLSSIDVDRDKISMRVKVSTNKATNTTYNSIPLSNDHRNIDLFERSIYSDVLSMIRQCERDHIRCGKKYAAARDLDDAQQEAYRRDAENFLDQEGVTNEDIREAYIDSYSGDKSSDHWRSKVVDEATYTLFQPSYLTFCLWVGSTELYDRYKMLIENANDYEIDNEEFIAEYEELVGEYEIHQMGEKK